MKITKLLVCTGFAAVSLASGAIAQSERMSPGAGGGGGEAPAGREEMAPKSGGEMPGSRTERGTSGAERGSSTEGAGRADRSEAQERGGSKKDNDTAKSEKGGRDGSASTGASEGAAGRDNQDKSGQRSKDAAESKPGKNDNSSSGASEGTAGSDSKPSGSVTQLSGEKRTKVQSAFRSHKSEATVKDIDIDISVGVAVPRSVTLYAVPEDVVVIVPEYRRYKYFIVEDKVVIVDPDTFAIVDVLILV